jgi:hypothetical protein
VAKKERRGRRHGESVRKGTTTIALFEDSAVSAILQALITRCEREFPGRIRSYYLIGSRADNSSVSSSDLDLDILFRDDVQPDEEARIVTVATDCSKAFGLTVDAWAMNAQQLIKDRTSLMIPRVTIKTGAVLVYGEELRGQIALPPFEDYRHWVVRAPIVNFGSILRHVKTFASPLDYPDPGGEFYGYVSPPTPNVGQDDERGTKDFVASVCWTATARIALDARQIIGRRQDSVSGYRAQVGDTWTELLEAICSCCRTDWNYRVPSGKPARVALRKLCRRALGFENDYLRRYRVYLLAELRRSDEAALEALARLAEVRYPDDEIREAVSQFATHSELKLRRAAGRALSPEVGRI